MNTNREFAQDVIFYLAIFWLGTVIPFFWPLYFLYIIISLVKLLAAKPKSVYKIKNIPGWPEGINERGERIKS